MRAVNMEGGKLSPAFGSGTVCGVQSGGKPLPCQGPRLQSRTASRGGGPTTQNPLNPVSPPLRRSCQSCLIVLFSMFTAPQQWIFMRLLRLLAANHSKCLSINNLRATLRFPSRAPVRPGRTQSNHKRRYDPKLRFVRFFEANQSKRLSINQLHSFVSIANQGQSRPIKPDQGKSR